MEDVNKVLADAENVVAKAVDMNMIGDTAGANNLLAARDLDPIIKNLADRGTPFMDKVQTEDGFGAGFSFNLFEAMGSQVINPRDAVYADGGVPSLQDPDYGSKYVAYKSIGWKGAVTGLAQKTGESVVDLFANRIQQLSRQLIHTLEYLAFWGSASITNGAGFASYDGLDVLITSNVIDAAGAAITKALVDRAAVRIQMKGGMATDIFCSLRVAADINDLYNSTNHVIVNMPGADALTLGQMVPEALTVAGRLKIQGDFFLNPGNTYTLPNGTSSSPLGATTSTVFVLNMNFITQKYLQRPVVEEYGRVADKREFHAKAYTALKLAAEPWCAKIINVKDNTLA